MFVFDMGTLLKLKIIHHVSQTFSYFSSFEIFFCSKSSDFCFFQKAAVFTDVRWRQRKQETRFFCQVFFSNTKGTLRKKGKKEKEKLLRVSASLPFSASNWSASTSFPRFRTINGRWVGIPNRLQYLIYPLAIAYWIGESQWAVLWMECLPERIVYWCCENNCIDDESTN